MPQLVENFIEKYNLQASKEVRYIDLISEVGELGKEILKATDYGKENWTENPDIAEELGDCLFSLLALCSALDIDAEIALQSALSKYEARFVQKGSIGS